MNPNSSKSREKHWNGQKPKEELKYSHTEYTTTKLRNGKYTVN
jgi:hypothetical protein